MKGRGEVIRVALGGFVLQLSLVGEDTIHIDATPSVTVNHLLPKHVVVKMPHKIATTDENESELVEEEEKQVPKDQPTGAKDKKRKAKGGTRGTRRKRLKRDLESQTSAEYSNDCKGSDETNPPPDEVSDEANDKMVGFVSLPAEILQLVFSFLPMYAAANMSRVCRQFKAVSEDETFWRHAFMERFGCGRFMEMNWRQRCVFAERKARIIENHAVYGDRMIWATRYGFVRYFKQNVSAADSAETLTDNLRVASFEGHIKIVKAILDHFEAHQEVGDVDNWQQALHTAALSGEKEIVELLLARAVVHPDIAEVGSGKTALMLAASAGHVSIARLLIDHGADLNHQDTDGVTSLLSAVESSIIKLVELLIDRGADIDIANSDGVTPLICAAGIGQSDIVRLLIEKGADINARNFQDRTALMEASLLNRVEVVDTLLRFGADVTAVDARGHSAYSLAFEKGHQTILDMLSRVIVVDGYTLEGAMMLMLPQPAQQQLVFVQPAEGTEDLPSEEEFRKWKRGN